MPEAITEVRALETTTALGEEGLASFKGLRGAAYCLFS
jgi:hypothetical protein